MVTTKETRLFRLNLKIINLNHNYVSVYFYVYVLLVILYSNQKYFMSKYVCHNLFLFIRSSKIIVSP